MRNNFRLLVISFAAILSCSQLMAQGPKRPGRISFDKEMAEYKESIEVINSHRVAYLSKRMGLTTAEAQIFWPLFNEYNAKTESLRAQRRKLISHYHQYGISYSNEQSIEFARKSIELQAQVYELKEQFRQKLTRVLNPQKVAAFFEAEDGFKQYLLRQLNQGQ